MTITHKQRLKNLAKLADYLETLPNDLETFDMGDFYVRDDEDTIEYITTGETHCGTPACALGHGPAAGIIMSSENLETYKSVLYNSAWRSYLNNFVEGHFLSTPAEWLFAGAWVAIDNTPHGAAARIWAYLDNETSDVVTPMGAIYSSYGFEVHRIDPDDLPYQKYHISSNRKVDVNLIKERLV